MKRTLLALFAVLGLATIAWADGLPPPTVMPDPGAARAAAPSPAVDCPCGCRGECGCQGDCEFALFTGRPLERLGWRVLHPFQGRLEQRAQCAAGRTVGILRGLIGRRCRCR